ncbi:hypothetical protein SAY86_002972 [Trapa natans]|uniref:50S ribosomal protein L18, chloroplastic n=1 Tax=Trapa natans TaxID=22666 RepID=A0AAN7LE52_TRANT|nr:hypothetical protein SAY86_002972 [Trapa natans]
MERFACVNSPKVASCVCVVSSVQLTTRVPLGSCFVPSNLANPIVKPQKCCFARSPMIEAKGKPRTESPKIRNRRIQNKFTGTPTNPRLSVFCSDKQLYAMLVDDQNKKCFFYGSTLQRSIRGDPPCSTVEAAQRIGEELVRVCVDLDIHEISSYDRNGSPRSERMAAFEMEISRHGFLPR